MEDDFIVSSEFINNENALIDQLTKTSWGIVYFGHVIAIGNIQLPKLILYDDSILTTHCYGVNGPVISRLISFLKKLLANPPGSPEGGTMSLDGAYWHFRKKNPDCVTLIASPSLISQVKVSSDVHPSWFDRILLLRNIASLVKRIRNYIHVFCN